MWAYDLDDEEDDAYVPPRSATPGPSPPPGESIARRTRAHADLRTVDLDEWTREYEDILDRADEVRNDRRSPSQPPSPAPEDRAGELYGGGEVGGLGRDGEEGELLPFAALLDIELPDDDNDEEYAPTLQDEDEDEEYRDDYTTKVSSQ